MSAKPFVAPLIFLAIGIATTGCGDATAQERQAKLRDSEFALQTQRVVVFKDGYCMVIKKGVATTDDDGFAFTEEVPEAAVLGSFWAIPQEGTVLKSTTAGWVETKTESEIDVDCMTTLEILKANLGATCSFTYDEQDYHGTILKVLSTDSSVNAPPQTLKALGVEPLFPATSAAELASRKRAGIVSTQASTITRTTGNFFILRTFNGDMIVPQSGVQRLVIDNMKSSVKQTVKQQIKRKRLSLHFDKPNSQVEITLMYFRPGVRWIPTYRVELTDEEFVKKGEKNKKVDPTLVKRTANISLQGEIINEAEDLMDMPIDVVVGVPNFRFRSVASPMVLENTLRNVIAQMPPNIVGNGMNLNSMSNALYTQRVSEFSSARSQGQPAAAQVELPDELKSSGGNDLFVYQLPRMSLKRGERATVPILRTEVPYRDIYTWDIKLKHAETYAASSSGAVSPLVLAENQVWRQVELINETDIPWTTGAAMFVDGFQPLAQDLLTYTSPGGICRVPVTVSVDLRGRVEDQELKRELKALRWRGSDYALVDGEIAIELANNKTVPVPVEVRVRFGGKALKATDEGDIKLEMYQSGDWHGGGSAVNNSSVVFWKSTIQPGECFKPKTEYEFYVRY